jgi:hypothetical protein
MHRTARLIQHSTAQHSTVQHSTAHHITAQHITARSIYRQHSQIDQQHSKIDSSQVLVGLGMKVVKVTCLA